MPSLDTSKAGEEEGETVVDSMEVVEGTEGTILEEVAAGCVETEEDTGSRFQLIEEALE